MKISDIKVYSFHAGFRNICLVKVETDAGFYGWGESGLSGREKAVEGAILHFKHFLIGKSAINTAALWQEMYRSQYFEGGRVLSAAIAAIDIALHDLYAKSLNIPVYQLLGGKQRDHIPLFATSTLAFGPDLIQHALQLEAQGWEVIRVTTGEHGDSQFPTVFEPRKSIASAAHWLTKLKQKLKPSTVLGIDYHHRLNVAETVSFVQKMPPDTLDFIEEPIRAQSPSAYQELRKMCDVPFAIGEEFTSKWDFAPFVNSSLTNFARIDVCNAGGFTEAMKIAALCELNYIDMMPHNPLSPLCTAASIHFCSAISNLAWLEVLPYADGSDDYTKVFINNPSIENNMFTVPSSPGLGIDVNEDYVAQQSFKFWEAPRLYKPDGSYTNW